MKWMTHDNIPIFIFIFEIKTKLKFDVPYKQTIPQFWSQQKIIIKSAPYLHSSVLLAGGKLLSLASKCIGSGNDG